MFRIVATCAETGKRSAWGAMPNLPQAVRLVLSLREDGDGSDRFEIRWPNGRLVTVGDVKRAGLDPWTGEAA